MALTPLRWGALAVGGALMVLALIFAPTRERRRVFDPRQSLAGRASIINAATDRAAEEVRVVHVRDSVLAALALMPRVDTSRVFIDPGLRGYLPRALSMLTSRTASYRASAPRVSVDLAFVLDTVTAVRGVGRGSGALLTPSYVLPRGSSDRCTVIVRVRAPRNEISPLMTRGASWAFVRANYSLRLLGPCAFVERFGVPGPQVDRWLMAGAWRFGTTVRWHRAAVEWQSPWSYGGFNRGSTGWPLRDFITNDGYRCASGDAATCESILTDEIRRVTRYDVTIMPDARMVSLTGLYGYTRWSQVTLGPFQASYLSDMAREIGPEQFQRFWSSSKPVAQSFRDATGIGLGDWTVRWATQSYGHPGRGPGVPASGALLALGLVAVSAAGAGIAARRRQVR